MKKIFRPKLKNILLMDTIAALIFIVHLIFFELITAQGEYLANKAQAIIPGYGIINVAKWIIIGFMLIGRQAYRMHLFRTKGGFGGSDHESFLVMGILNFCAMVFTVIKAPKMYAFLSIALSHAVVKTIIAVVTYIVPVVLMFAVVVLVVMWFATDRIKSTE